MRRLLAALPLLLGASASAVTVAPAAVWPSAAALNARMADVDGWRSGDSGRTVALADGRLLSLFGDSTLADGRFVHNSAVLSDPTRSWLAASTLFPDFPDGSRFWPGQAVAVGQRVYVVGSRQLVRGAFDWTALGAYTAVLDVPWGGRPVFRRYGVTPSSGQVGDDRVQWYGGLWVDAGYAYVHGVLDRPEAFHARDGGFVARVPVDHLGRLSCWRFWTGQGWSADAGAAVSTIPVSGSGGTSGGYTVHRDGATWQVVTKRGGDLADVLGRFTSFTPTGPWVWEPLLSVPPSYLAGAAPQVALADGALLVQWSPTGGPYPTWAEVPR